jgi:hypothetical protein
MWTEEVKINQNLIFMEGMAVKSRMKLKPICGEKLVQF